MSTSLAKEAHGNNANGDANKLHSHDVKENNQGASKMSQSPQSHTLHDLLSMGKIEAALSSFSPSGYEEGRSDFDDGLGIRLPLLLKLLSVAQPLATTSSSQNINDTPYSSSSSSTTLPDPNVIVPLLENVAAAHPDAENMEVLVSSIVPSICKHIGNLPQLTHSTNEMDGITTWNTESIDTALKRLRNLTSTTHHAVKRRMKHSDDSDAKRQKSDKGGPMPGRMKTVIDIPIDEDGDTKMQDDNKVESQNEVVVNQSSFLARASSASDSHESATRRVLQELLELVKSSLRTEQNDDSLNDDDGGVGEDGGVDESRQLSSSNDTNAFFRETGFIAPGLSLKSDSLFSDADDVSSSLGGGWSRLTVMVPTLMQNATILKHEHVACALCRAALHQAPVLIKAMAANNPSATRDLLRGCIIAYQLAEKFISSSTTATTHTDEGDMHTSNLSKAKDIIQTSVEATESLASLSPREALNVIRILREKNVMDGLVLSLLIRHDESIAAASFIVEKLSSSSSTADTTSTHDITNPTLDANDTKSDAISESAPAENTSTSRLFKELENDKMLAENARRYISQRMIRLLETRKSKKGISLREGSLFIKAYALLVYFIGIGAGSSSGSGTKFVVDSISAISTVVDGESSIQDQPTKSSKDNVYKLSICAAISTCCKHPPIGDCSKGSVMGGPAVKACLECIQQLLLYPESIESVIFSARVAGFIVDSDAKSLLKLVVETILPESNSSGCSEEEDVSQMSNVCRWLSSKVELESLNAIHSRGMTTTSLVHDPIVVAETMRRSDTQKPNELDELAKKALLDREICSKAIHHPHACILVQESVAMLVRRPEPHIPIVLPLTLERISQQLPWEEISISDGIKTSTKHVFAQFVLQLLYALEFLERQPLSPFAINPRLLPLKESLAFLDKSCQEYNKGCGFGMMSTALKELTLKHCPDLLRVNMIEKDGLIISRKHIVKPMLVYEAIRDCLNGDSVDPSGLRAERMFVLSRSVYPSLEVDVAAMGAILAVRNSQPKFYSYVALCKDPLILLKASGSAWKLRGVRFILLQILDSLMSANECIVMQSSETETVAQDYLTSRDAIIVKCIVFACAYGFIFGRGCEGGVIPRARHCMLCVSMIRSIVSKRQGIIASLIKQGLPDQCMEWIVKFIPQSLSDAPIIITLLDKGYLSATQRFNVASAGLQIAVAHSQREDSMAKSLITAANSVLLDSFTLVVGPVGVPVSVLREENGQDVTNICRKAMFQMLKTLATISPKNTDLKNEACITLSKIAAMCKSENAVGGASSRRKALLKDIWEKCLQANASLGMAMQF